MTTKTTTTKSAAPKAPRKPRATTAAKKTIKAPTAHKVEAVAEVKHAPVNVTADLKGKYIFATGRRKTAIANVRMFEGSKDTVVNKKPINTFFGYSFHFDEVLKPLEVTGLKDKYYFVANINGGGPHAQAIALRHGISVALSQLSEEVRKVLKKNGFLTRDDRKKERKKPGLKRARRSPQWAKR